MPPTRVRTTRVVTGLMTTRTGVLKQSRPWETAKEYADGAMEKTNKTAETIVVKAEEGANKEAERTVVG